MPRISPVLKTVGIHYEKIKKGGKRLIILSKISKEMEYELLDRCGTDRTVLGQMKTNVMHMRMIFVKDILIHGIFSEK